MSADVDEILIRIREVKIFNLSLKVAVLIEKKSLTDISFEGFILKSDEKLKCFCGFLNLIKFWARAFDIKS